MDVSDKEFWKKMEPIIFSVTKGVWAPGFTRDDLINEARIGIWEASLTWDLSKGCTWNSFASVCAKRKVIDLITHSNRKKNQFFSLAEWIERTEAYEIPDMELLSAATEAKRKLHQIINAAKLTDKEREVIELILLGYTYTEIAHKLNTTYKAVDNSIQRAMKKFKLQLTN